MQQRRGGQNHPRIHRIHTPSRLSNQEIPHLGWKRRQREDNPHGHHLGVHRTREQHKRIITGGK